MGDHRTSSTESTQTPSLEPPRRHKTLAREVRLGTCHFIVALHYFIGSQLKWEISIFIYKLSCDFPTKRQVNEQNKSSFTAEQKAVGLLRLLPHFGQKNVPEPVPKKGNAHQSFLVQQHPSHRHRQNIVFKLAQTFRGHFR